MSTTHHSRRQQRSALPTPDARRRPLTLLAWKHEIDFLVLCALLILVALGGGSAFADTLSLIYVRLAAVIALAAFLLTPASPGRQRSLAAPFAFLALLAVIMIAQLVPLPPSIWAALPGRAPYLEAAIAAGVPQPWRPLSLTPDLTINSLVSLIVPVAVLVGFAKLDMKRRDRLLIGFLILCLASTAMGIAQLGGGSASPLYLYKRTHEGTPVGLLANRNHQAALLAAFFPALRVWTLSPTADRGWNRSRLWLALALGVVAVPLILATGSRAGIALALASLAATFALFSPDDRHRHRATTEAPDWMVRLLRTGVPALLMVMVFATWWFGRALSIQRLTGAYPAVDEDLRFKLAPVVVNIVRKTFPAGTGFGSFDPVFRQYEPDSVLSNSFFNHAHNEILELALTAGIAGVVWLVGFLIWWAIRCFQGARDRPQTHAARFVILGGTVTGIFMVASIVDYPLRTPLLAAWFAIACGWLCTGRDPPASATHIAVPDEPL